MISTSRDIDIEGVSYLYSDCRPLLLVLLPDVPDLQHEEVDAQREEQHVEHGPLDGEAAGPLLSPQQEAGLGGALGVPAVVMALSAGVAGSRGGDADAAHLRGGGGGDGGVQ